VSVAATAVVTLSTLGSLFGVDASVGARIDVPAVNRKGLAIAFKALGFQVGAEIGVETGEYSEVLSAKNPHVRLFCIDAWKAYRGYRDHVSQAKLDGFYDTACERLRPFPNTKLVRGFSSEIAKDTRDGSLDFVYIDANHKYEHVVADIAAWEPKVRSGGIISGHDFRRSKGKASATFGVVDAVTGWTRAYDIKPWFVLRGDRSPSWLWVKA
jgi:hypothetical protein